MIYGGKYQSSIRTTSCSGARPPLGYVVSPILPEDIWYKHRVKRYQEWEMVVEEQRIVLELILPEDM